LAEEEEEGGEVEGHGEGSVSRFFQRSYPLRGSTLYRTWTEGGEVENAGR